jgi:hypothetical protein
LYVLAVAGVAGWSDSSEALEVAREMALIGETGGGRNRRDGLALAKQGLCPEDAKMHLVSVRRHANHAAKRSMKVVGAESGGGRQMSERDGPVVVRVQKLLRQPQAVWFYARRGITRAALKRRYQICKKAAKQGFVPEART